MRNKECKKCGESHPIDKYDWNNKKLGYRKSYCRDCCNAIYDKWKIDNAERNALNRKLYYEKNKERYGASGKPKGRPAENTLKSGVYLITNTITNETYVGCSSNVKTRIYKHLDYNRGRAKSKELSKAIKKYGREAFESKVLELCERALIFEREAYWMSQYKCEYNRNKK